MSKAKKIITVLIIFILTLSSYFIMFPKKAELLSPFINSDWFFINQEKNKEVIGFLPYWLAAKKVNIDTKKISQLIYFGLEVNDGGSLRKYDENGYKTPEYVYLNSDYIDSLFKQARKTNTKVLLTVSNFNTEEIETLISSKEAVYTLLSEMQEILDIYAFDGFNLDFEYFPKQDNDKFKKDFNHFIGILTSGLKAKNKDLIISFDIYPNAIINGKPYDIKTISSMVDEVIIMGYDFHQAGSENAGPVSPLKGNGNGKNLTEAFKAVYPSIEAKKLVLGIPFYGYEWQTYTSDYKSFTIGTGALASYQRVRQLIKEEKLERKWDEDTQTPFLVYEDGRGRIKQIYFEDEKSLALKMDLVNQLNIKGIAIWALGYEGSYQDLWQVIAEKNRKKQGS
jgi:spore germination protein